MIGEEMDNEIMIKIDIHSSIDSLPQISLVHDTLHQIGDHGEGIDHIGGGGHGGLDHIDSGGVDRSNYGGENHGEGRHRDCNLDTT